MKVNYLKKYLIFIKNLLKNFMKKKKVNYLLVQQLGLLLPPSIEKCQVVQVLLLVEFMHLMKKI